MLGNSDNKKQQIELICNKLATMEPVFLNSLLITGPSPSPVEVKNGVATIMEDIMTNHEEADINKV